MPKLEKHGIPGKRLLDVACGTGASGLRRVRRRLLPRRRRQVEPLNENGGSPIRYGHHHDAIPHQPLDEVEHAKGVYVARTA